MNNRNINITYAALLAFALWSPLLFAQHADIEAELDPAGSASGTFIVDPHDEVPTTSAIKPGRKLFEVEFGELGNPFGTDDPGFEIEDGNGIAGTILGFNVLDSLWKWDGAGWTDSGFDEVLTITDVLSNNALVSANIGAGLSGLIDQFDSEGGVHSHVEFEISSTSGTPMDGAYLLELSLMGRESDGTTPVYNDSDPFLIAFHLDNGGAFGEEAFEGAVDALLAPVPIPGAAWLLGSAILAAGGVSRRKQRTA